MTEQKIIETLKLALKALEGCYDVTEWPASGRTLQDKAITALRTAIEAAEKQEPVAWAVVGDGEHGEYEVGRMLEKKSKPNSQYWEARGYSLVPLYTTPPAAPVHEQTTTENNGGKTGWPPGLLQDDNSRLSKWFASKPDARQKVRDAAAPVQEPVRDEDELSNGLALALHDAVLIRIGKDDEATRQAIARIDKLVAKYTSDATPTAAQRQPLTDDAKAVIDAARVAMNQSFEANDGEGSIMLSSETAASLSLCLDEYDRAIEAAHGIGEKK